MANYNLTQTGAEVQAILNRVAAGYIYMGVADLTTTPDTTNPKVYYLLTAVGTYTNFGNIQHSSGIGIALWNGTAWSYQNVPSSAVVETDATLTENSTTPVQSGAVWSGLQYSTYNPLAGVTFGNNADDNKISSTLKGIWIDIKSAITLPQTLYFSLYRNKASNGWFFRFTKSQSSSTSEILFQSSGTPKMTGKNDIVVAGYGDFSGKADLHLSLDFTNYTSDISVTYGTLGSYITPSLLNTSVGTNMTLKDKIDEMNAEFSASISSINNVLEDYTDSLRGVTFDGTTAAQTIKGMVKGCWLQVLDETAEIPSELYIKSFRNDSTYTGDYQCVVTIGDADATYFTYYQASAKTGTEELVVYGYSSLYGKANLHLSIEWGSTSVLTNVTGVSFNTDELNTEPTETYTLAQYVTSLKPLYNKNIVVFGDSITERTDATSMGWCNYFSLFTGSNVINVGIGGTQLRQRATPAEGTPTSTTEAYAALDIYNMVKASCLQSFTQQTAAANYLLSQTGDDNTLIVSRLSAINWAKIDAVVVLAGTNDWRNAGQQIGATGSNDPNTTLGAINEIVRLLLSTYKHISLYYCTPIVRWIADSLSERTDANWCDVYTNADDKNLRDYSKILSDEFVKNHIPVCDLYNTMGWNKYNFSEYFKDTDGTHPDKGYDEIGAKIGAFVVANKTF